MRRIVLTFIAAGTLTLPATSEAQRVEVIQQGAQIRISVRGKAPQVGLLDSLNAGSLAMTVIDRSSGSPAFSVSRDQVIALEIRRKNAAVGALKGAAIGLFAGAIGGALIGAVTYEEPKGFCLVFCSRTDATALVGMFGAMVGTPVGLIAGAAHGFPSWRRVDLKTVRMP